MNMKLFILSKDCKFVNWSSKSVLVTGAGGFIGSHLTEALADQGADVTAVLRYTSEQNIGNLKYLPSEKFDKLNLVFGNVEDQSFVEHTTKDKDVIFHLAALIGIPYSYYAPQSYVSTNIVGTMNFLEAAKKHNPEISLFTSTSEVYGTAQYTPIDERHPLVGQSPYSATKIGADKLVESYYLSFDAPVAIVRPFNTFGPRQSTRAVIPTIISQAIYSDKIVLGDLETTRDLVFVKDTAQGFIKLAEKPFLGEPTNLATGREISIGKLAETIRDKVNPSMEIIHDKSRFRPSKSEVRQLLGAADKVKTIGWEPKYSFEQAIDETIEWFSTQWQKSRGIGEYTI